MNAHIERGPAILLAGAVIVAGIIFGAGAFVGGYALGESRPDAAPTALAETTYTGDDLSSALAACEIEAGAVEDGSVTLLGADQSPMKRQCFVAEMGATELASREYGFSSWSTPKEDYLEEGEYVWSNVHMIWEQTNDGRNVTISVE